jgi:hypothetical protein
MGSRGTMIVEREQKVMLFTERDPSRRGQPSRETMVSVTTTSGDKPVLDSGSTWGGPSASASAAPTTVSGGSSAPVSRGYREEMEDFAYCVRIWDPKLGYATRSDGTYQQRLPRCHGKIAMADAIIALTANLAMKNRQRIEFRPEWFDPDSPAVPDAST